MIWAPEARPLPTPPKESDEYRTPPYLFRYASHLYGHIDVDLAATPENALCDRFFTRDDSAFDFRWHLHGVRGWCNPPYSNIDPWVDKAIMEAEDGFHTIMLLPSLNGDSRDAVVLRNASELTLIIGRISFIRPSGKITKGNNRGSCLVSFNQRVKSISTPRMLHKFRDNIKDEHPDG